MNQQSSVVPFGSPSVLRLPAVLRMIGLSRPTLYRMVKAGTFPQPIKLGAAAVGWLADDVSQWIAERVTARDAHLQPAAMIAA